MSDRASLNLTTIGAATLEQKLHAARAAGFSAVGLAWDEMERLGEEGILEIRLSELHVTELAGISGWMDAGRSSRLVAAAQAEQAFELAANLDCPLVIAWPSPGPVDPVAAALHFQELCRLARPFAARVGLEFVGHFEQLKDLAAAWAVVEAAAADNGGLVIDAFHLHRGESTLEMLDPIPVEKIYLVEISDCVDLPLYELQDCHRVYPGTGTLALEPLLAALRAKGYSGHYSLELRNEDYWAEDPLTVARDGLRAMRRLDLA